MNINYLNEPKAKRYSFKKEKGNWFCTDNLKMSGIFIGGSGLTVNEALKDCIDTRLHIKSVTKVSS